MKKSAQSPLEKMANEILDDYLAANHGVDEDAVHNRKSEMFHFMKQWTKPSDLLVLLGQCPELKEVWVKGTEGVSVRDLEQIHTDFVAAVLGLYALAEQRMVVHMEKLSNEKG